MDPETVFTVGQTPEGDYLLIEPPIDDAALTALWFLVERVIEDLLCMDYDA